MEGFDADADNRAIMLDFLAAARGGMKPVVTVEDGFRTLVAAEAVFRSMQEGRRVRLDEIAAA